MAAAFHHHAQIVLADEIDARNHVCVRSGRHRVRASARRPCVKPARDLGATGIVAERDRVSRFLEAIGAILSAGRFCAGLPNRLWLQQIPANRPAQFVPVLRVWPTGIGGPNAARSFRSRKCVGEGRDGCEKWQCGNPLLDASSLHICLIPANEKGPRVDTFPFKLSTIWMIVSSDRFWPRVCQNA